MHKLSRLLGALLTTISLSAFATPVTLQSFWLGSPATFSGLGSLTFTYENTTAATDVHAYGTSGSTATYVNAVTAATFTFDNITLSFDESVDSKITIRSQVSSGTDASILMYFRDPNDIQYSVQIGFEDNHRVFTNTELSNLIGELPDESGTILRPIVLPPGHTISRYVLAQQTPLALVPAPSAVWLFGSSMIGFVGVARRRK